MFCRKSPKIQEGILCDEEEHQILTFETPASKNDKTDFSILSTVAELFPVDRLNRVIASDMPACSTSLLQRRSQAVGVLVAAGT